MSNPIPMNQISHPLMDTTTDTGITELITAGVHLREVLDVLNAWLKHNKGCVVGYQTRYHCRVIAMSNDKAGITLFKHVTLAACIEFALKYEG